MLGGSETMRFRYPLVGEVKYRLQENRKATKLASDSAQYQSRKETHLKATISK